MIIPSQHASSQSHHDMLLPHNAAGRFETWSAYRASVLSLALLLLLLQQLSWLCNQILHTCHQQCIKSVLWAEPNVFARTPLSVFFKMRHSHDEYGLPNDLTLHLASYGSLAFQGLPAPGRHMQLCSPYAYIQPLHMLYTTSQDQQGKPPVAISFVF